MFLLSGIAWYVNIHRAHLFAYSAGDAFLFIYFNTEQRKVTHWFQKNCNRADVFAKGSVIFALISNSNSNNVVEDVSNEEAPPHDVFLIWNLKNKKQADKYE